MKINIKISLVFSFEEGMVGRGTRLRQGTGSELALIVFVINLEQIRQSVSIWVGGYTVYS